MGYSCNARAAYTLDTIIPLIQAVQGDAGGSSNSWGDRDGKMWFFERGREQADGSITGTVYGPSPTPGCCRKVGSAKIAADGTIIRFPTSTPGQRKLAKETSDAKYGALHGLAA